MRREYVGGEDTAVLPTVVLSPDGTRLVTATNHIVSQLKLDGSGQSTHHFVRIWDVATGVELRRLSHSHALSSIAVSPDGVYVVTGTTWGDVRIWPEWDEATWEGVTVLAGHIDKVNSIAFIMDAATVTNRKNAYRCFQDDKDSIEQEGFRFKPGSAAPQGATSATWNRATGCAEALAKPMYLLTGSHDGTARIWGFNASYGSSMNTSLARELHTMTHYDCSYSSDYCSSSTRIAVQTVAVGTDYVATAVWDGSVRIWNVPSAMLPVMNSVSTGSGWRSVTLGCAQRFNLRRFDALRDVAPSMTLTADGQYVVTASVDETTTVWDVATGNIHATFEDILSERHEFEMSEGALSPYVAVSADGMYIVTGGNFSHCYLGPGGPTCGTAARIWAMSRELYPIPLVASLPVKAVAFNPAGDYVIMGAHDLRVFDTTGHLVAAAYETGVRSFAVSPDGTFVMVGYGDRATMWKLKDISSDSLVEHNGVKLLEELMTFVHTSSVESVAVSPDIRYVVTGSSDHRAHIWDVATGEEVRSLDGHMGDVGNVAVSLGGSYILTSSSDDTVRIWSAYDGAHPHTLYYPNPHGADHTTAYKGTLVAVNPSGDEVVTVSDNSDVIWIWNSTSGEMLHLLDKHTSTVTALAVSENFVVTAGLDSYARIWDARSGAEVMRFLIPSGSGRICLAVSPDESYIVAGRGQRARIWDTSSRDELHVLDEHLDDITSIAVSPDGKYVITASADWTARIWDAYSGDVLQRLLGHEEEVISIAVSPTGKFVVTASDDGTARIWAMPIPTRTTLTVLEMSALDIKLLRGDQSLREAFLEHFREAFAEAIGISAEAVQSLELTNDDLRTAALDMKVREEDQSFASSLTEHVVISVDLEEAAFRDKRPTLSEDHFKELLNNAISDLGLHVLEADVSALRGFAIEPTIAPMIVHPMIEMNGESTRIVPTIEPASVKVRTTLAVDFSVFELPVDLSDADVNLTLLTRAEQLQVRRFAKDVASSYSLALGADVTCIERYRDATHFDLLTFSSTCTGERRLMETAELTAEQTQTDAVGEDARRLALIFQDACEPAGTYTGTACQCPDGTFTNPFVQPCASPSPTSSPTPVPTPFPYGWLNGSNAVLVGVWGSGNVEFDGLYLKAPAWEDMPCSCPVFHGVPRHLHDGYVQQAGFDQWVESFRVGTAVLSGYTLNKTCGAYEGWRLGKSGETTFNTTGTTTAWSSSSPCLEPYSNVGSEDCLIPTHGWIVRDCEYTPRRTDGSLKDVDDDPNPTKGKCKDHFSPAPVLYYQPEFTLNRSAAPTPSPTPISTALIIHAVVTGEGVAEAASPTWPFDEVASISIVSGGVTSEATALAPPTEDVTDGTAVTTGSAAESATASSSVRPALLAAATLWSALSMSMRVF
jgi:WD40 repeat protein